ncbi:sulfite exporter TauE/SafE family protein [Uliginosibacterium sp. H1]|uniref:sulfite exporter TauE/SafE family protein n=1 Tax=Uliginosibacterium sp. H1 TaxID=3114757 RepID=UPI002E19EABD|nr:sulfite exporter TauE/SafE family protein [Uliginosibacterium sp. H1]
MDSPPHPAQHARMDAMSSGMMVFVTAVFLAAGAVKGVSGMGLPTVAMSLLGLAMPTASAAALLVAPSLATNLAQCFGAHTRRLVALLWPVWLALVLATIFLPLPADAESQRLSRIALGAVLVLYGLWGLAARKLPQPTRALPGWGLLVGGVTGVITAATAVFVMPLVPYLQALRLERDALIQALGLSFTVATVALAIRLQGSASLHLLSVPVALAFAAAFAGMWLGSRLRAGLSGPAFQRTLHAVFIALGSANLWNGLARG